ncbi:DNA polymerase epsilon subunit 4 [Carabus blaptoides fortunei]
MTESQESLFEPSQAPDTDNDDELIAQVLREESENALVTNEEPIEEEKESAIDKANNDKLTRFPLARIKTLMKMDPDLNLASQEAVFLVARATELFLKNLAKETYVYTTKAKRKTVQKRDLDAVIETIDTLCFLEGALD